ncbi:MAG: short-chain dehydrogenase, partial [Novosphingobium sp.]|nr:short-chain dehydrogenase [Novosphingobium sp.]
ATESEAAAKQGIDIAKLHNVMPAREAARLSLDNLTEGPTYFPSAFYKASFDQLLAMPRRDALRVMAQGMKGG